MSSIPYDEPRCSAPMCPRRIERRFTTIDGQALALCGRHDEMFYATCIVISTPSVPLATRRAASAELAHRTQTWSVA